jgi:hypothetical protein
MLRNLLFATGVVGLVVAIGFLVAGQYAPGLQILIGSGVLTVGVAFERWRYVRSLTGPKGRWQLTGERFMDPTTYRLTDVYYNPDTGERDYRPAADDDRRIEPPRGP